MTTSEQNNPLAVQVCLMVILLGTLLAYSSPSATAQDNITLSVPAEIIRDLTPPGTADGFVRPEGVFVDNRFGEVFVSDPGNNRVVVFDTSGLFKFEFSCADIFGTPGDLVVDSRGYIFVLGSIGSGRAIYQFDYDGVYLRQLPLSGLPENTAPSLSHLTIDAFDRLYVVDGDQAAIYTFDLDGKMQRSFSVLTELSDQERQEAIFGLPTVFGGLIYLPVSTSGRVYVYDLDGNYLRIIGEEGIDVGKLNFPVAVAVSPDSVVMVLDKHRCNVVCFEIEGRFVGEFGGMGYRRGWFYHPNSLAVDTQGRCYITQIYLNLVQVSDLPKSILTETRATTSDISTQNGNSPLLAPIGEEVSRQDRTSNIGDNCFSTFKLIIWRFLNA